jgi:regulator of nucleoside diphosphate kinase
MPPRPPDERTLTESDHLQLTRLLERHAGAAAAPLRAVLDGAVIVAEHELPGDVVSMYSRVLLIDAHGADPRTVTLCYPADANASTGHLSVLSPAGSGLLGLPAGRVATWRTPDGREGRAEIAEVLFQPEAHRAGGGAPPSGTLPSHPDRQKART